MYYHRGGMATSAPTSSTVSGFTDALGRVVRSATLPRFAELVADEAGIHLDRSAFVLLAHLEAQPCRVGELAEYVRLDGSTVSRQVHALEQNALVTCEPHPTDRRGSVVVITPEGRQAINWNRQARRTIFAELLSDVSQVELEEVTAVLELLAARIEDLGGG